MQHKCSVLALMWMVLNATETPKITWKVWPLQITSRVFSFLSFPKSISSEKQLNEVERWNNNLSLMYIVSVQHAEMSSNVPKSNFVAFMDREKATEYYVGIKRSSIIVLQFPNIVFIFCVFMSWFYADIEEEKWENNGTNMSYTAMRLLFDLLNFSHVGKRISFYVSQSSQLYI